MTDNVLFLPGARELMAKREAMSRAVRLTRIYASLQRINSLMAGLRALSRRI